MSHAWGGQVRGMKQNAYVCAKIRWTQSCSFNSEAEALCFQTYYTLGKPITLPRQKKQTLGLVLGSELSTRKPWSPLCSSGRVSCKHCLHTTWRSPGSDGGEQQVDDFPNPTPETKEEPPPPLPPLQWFLPSTLGNSFSDTAVLMTQTISPEQDFHTQT